MKRQRISSKIGPEMRNKLGKMKRLEKFNKSEKLYKLGKKNRTSWIGQQSWRLFVLKNLNLKELANGSVKWTEKYSQVRKIL